MMDLIQTCCLAVIAISTLAIAARLGTIIQRAYPAPPEPFDYADIDRETYGQSGLVQRNSDYPLGN